MFARNAVWVISEKIFRALIEYGVFIILIQALDPIAFGSLSFALSFTIIFYAFVRLGLSNVVVKEFVAPGVDVRKVLSTTLYLRLIGGVLGYLLIVASLSVLTLDLDVSTVFLILGTKLFFLASETFENFNQSQFRSFVNARARIVSSLVMISLIFVLANSKASIEEFAILLLSESIFLALILFYCASIAGFKLEATIDVEFAVRILKQAWPFFLSILLTLAYSRLDQVMLGLIVRPVDVAIYSAAYKLAELWYIVPASIVSILMPCFLSRASKNSEYRCGDGEFSLLYALNFYFGILYCVLILFFGDILIDLLYGDGYSDSYNVIKYLSLVGVFVSQLSIFSIWLLRENYQRYILWMSFCGLIFNSLLNYSLIPEYGATGAAFATLLSQFILAWIFPSFMPALRSGVLIALKALDFRYIIQLAKRNFAWP